MRLFTINVCRVWCTYRLVWAVTNAHHSQPLWPCSSYIAFYSYLRSTRAYCILLPSFRSRLALEKWTEKSPLFIFSNSILYNQLKHVSLNTFFLRLRHVFPRASVVIVTYCAVRAPPHHTSLPKQPQPSTPHHPTQHHKRRPRRRRWWRAFIFQKTYNNFLPSCCCRFCCSEVFFLPVFYNLFSSFYVYSFFLFCSIFCRCARVMCGYLPQKRSNALCYGEKNVRCVYGNYCTVYIRVFKAVMGVYA